MSHKSQLRLSDAPHLTCSWNTVYRIQTTTQKYMLNSIITGMPINALKATNVTNLVLGKTSCQDPPCCRPSPLLVGASGGWELLDVMVDTVEAVVLDGVDVTTTQSYDGVFKLLASAPFPSTPKNTTQSSFHPSVSCAVGMHRDCSVVGFSTTEGPEDTTTMLSRLSLAPNQKTRPRLKRWFRLWEENVRGCIPSAGLPNFFLQIHRKMFNSLIPTNQQEAAPETQTAATLYTLSIWDSTAMAACRIDQLQASTREVSWVTTFSCNSMEYSIMMLAKPETTDHVSTFLHRKHPVLRSHHSLSFHGMNTSGSRACNMQKSPQLCSLYFRGREMDVSFKHSWWRRMHASDVCVTTDSPSNASSHRLASEVNHIDMYVLANSQTRVTTETSRWVSMSSLTNRI